jgi:hypothetical protein
MDQQMRTTKRMRYLQIYTLLLISCLVPQVMGNVFSRTVAPILETHCFDCHDAETKKGDLDLTALPHVNYGEAEAAIWSTAMDLVNAGEMPPKKKARLSDTELDSLGGWLENSLAVAVDRLRASRPKTRLRRLNRTEYRNTIRDLTGHPFDAAELFTRDTAEAGFDNVGEALQISPLHVESYVAAAERVVSKIIDVPPKRPQRQHWRIVNAVKPNEPMKRKNGDWHVGHNDKPKNRIAPGRLKGKPLPNAEIPNGSAPYRMVDLTSTPPTPWAGSWDIRAFGGGGRQSANFGFKWFAYEEGMYRLRIKLRGFAPASDVYPPVLSIVRYPEGTIWQEVPVPVGDHVFEYRFYRDAIPWYVQTSGNRHWGVNLRFPFHTPKNGKPVNWGVHVQYMEMEGPLDAWPPPWHQQVFGAAQKDEAVWARDVLQRFLTRAFRRPVLEEELARYLSIFQQERKAAKSFQEAMRLPLTTALCAPAFLYIAGQSKAPIPKAYILANRLSYFLWRSMPDEVLFSLAADGSLEQPEVLLAQVDRMLADSRSSALSTNFSAQWLNLAGLEHLEADRGLFPRFRPLLKDAMRAESAAFFQEVLDTDKNVLSFVDSDFLMLNDVMARHYGLPSVAGAEFRPVALPAGHQRGGVLTQAAVLTATANGVRTLPVTRGAFILSHILGTPPPSPPPDVGELEDVKTPKPNASIRERLELHRQDPTCARCHEKIDPLGFALEQFDAIGQWRVKERDGAAIDPAGQLPDGRKFAGIAELKQLLQAEPSHFVNCLSEKMLIYALDRPMGFADRPLVNQIGAATQRDGSTLRAMIKQIVATPDFRE